MSIFGEARREMVLFEGRVSAKTAKQLEEVGSDLLEALERSTNVLCEMHSRSADPTLCRGLLDHIKLNQQLMEKA